MAILGALIMPMIKSHKCATPHEQVVFIGLKGAIYYKYVQLGESSESDLEPCYEQASKKKLENFRTTQH